MCPACTTEITNRQVRAYVRACLRTVVLFNVHMFGIWGALHARACLLLFMYHWKLFSSAPSPAVEKCLKTGFWFALESRYCRVVGEGDYSQGTLTFWFVYRRSYVV